MRILICLLVLMAGCTPVEKPIDELGITVEETNRCRDKETGLFVKCPDENKR